jgi:hypothetical protein
MVKFEWADDPPNWLADPVYVDIKLADPTFVEFDDHALYVFVRATYKFAQSQEQERTPRAWVLRINGKRKELQALNREALVDLVKLRLGRFYADN